MHDAGVKKMVQLMDRPHGLYKTGDEIKEFFNISQSTYSKIRKLIKENPARYSHYAVIDRQTNILAFADAKVFAKQLRAGEKIPRFDPDKVGKMMGVLTNGRCK